MTKLSVNDLVVYVVELNYSTYCSTMLSFYLDEAPFSDKFQSVINAAQNYCAFLEYLFIMRE